MKIPKQAKRVFKGVIFDVYQWEQEMFDGSKETFEMAKRKISVETIVTQDNIVLFGAEEQPYKGNFYSLFGGKVENNETPLEGAKRELLEEAGLVSDDWELLRTYNTTPRMEWENNIFVARNARSVGSQKLESGEKIIIEKRNFDDFLEILMSPGFSVNPHFIIELLTIKYTEPKKLEEFKKKLGIT